ncbi:MAG: NAD(P)-dependent oxidoreductase [Bacteroidales bacterium]|nr:NAD(P)-dependent oxidoreductase [Bacteroidales bacterium]
MKQTILLTGACGTVGFETLKELISKKEKYEIRIFDLPTKKNKKKFKKFKKHIQTYWGDITKYSDIFEAVNGSDFIIHTAAIIPPAADKFPELAEKINVNGTKNICDAINNTNPEIFLLFTSSISVYGDRTENPEISVFDKLNPSKGDFYARTKIKAEEIVKINLKNFSIFRLSAVMHPKMKLDPLFFHMPLNTSLEIITTQNLAFALCEAIEKKDFINERIFNTGGGKNCRIKYEDFLNENFKIFGLKKLNFPKYAFAEKNFHCGFYKDSFVLENFLHFQKDTVDDYFIQVQKSVNPFTKFLSLIFSKLIKIQLLKKSEPYNAVKTKNDKLINLFFKKSYC